MFSFPGAPRKRSKWQRKKVCRSFECIYYKEAYEKETVDSVIKIEQDNKKIDDLNKLVLQLKAKINFLEEQNVEKDKLLASYTKSSNR